MGEWLLDKAELIPRPENPLDALPYDIARVIVTLPDDDFEMFMDEFLGKEAADEWRRQMDNYLTRIKRLVVSWRERGIL